MMLTLRQKELLLYIDGFQREHGGSSPSFDQMAVALNLASKSGIHRLIGALEERGFVERLHNRARSISVKRMPDCGTSTSFDRTRQGLFSSSAVSPVSGWAEQTNDVTQHASNGDRQQWHSDPRFPKALEMALETVQTLFDLSVERPSMGTAEKAVAIATLFLYHGVVPRPLDVDQSTSLSKDRDG